MFILMIVTFIIGYACIALENLLHIHKTATALLLAILLWIFFALGDWSSSPVYGSFLSYCEHYSCPNFATWLAHVPLVERLGEVSEILFFLLGAMTIVEIVDVYGGFRLITDKINTTQKVSLLWIIGLLTFVMSAVLDNLTTSIVIVALLRKLISNKKERWFFGSMVVLAANAGGTWSPIGDITTIMLWIADKVSSSYIIFNTFLPALTSIIIPFGILSFTMKGSITRLKTNNSEKEVVFSSRIRNFVFFLGIGALLFVPIFKTVTHLPPYLGMLGGLGILWIVTGFIHKKQLSNKYDYLSVHNILKQIDTPSILFFLGILMAVGALQTCGQLDLLSCSLEKISMKEPNKYYLISVIIGILSSIVDNVPLVAGIIGMYHFPINHYFWAFLAYTAGTGGSILIIGSAAGVAVMGMEKIDFIWYLKKISWLTLIGYLSGCFMYIFQQTLFLN
ncbi:sodium:proton antiporter NhaD [Candidatus Azobacteroides pseudotrichonymphae]|uniref:ArsB/NhaD family permease n=1 Tax=Azobacteroides pseudotrichonymphae genomovar. CFP2 TaxID=511995 RepID=B6YR84_AZOPC|nr:sodium:proton antiporter NhaD [Candidatus Azobacteroides pseudotrichonymphae]BAG83706.1 putative ArsB/NhaD family permease [Candidatus Azobacteroides pseudotrichonymphae genomovar. CFP2]